MNTPTIENCPDKDTHAYIPDDSSCPTCGAYWAENDPEELGQFLTQD